MTGFIAILTSVVSVAGLVAALAGHMHQVYEKARKDTVTIGIAPRVRVPEALHGIPCFSSPYAAVRARAKKAIVFCPSLSRALRTCDFVVYEPGCDPKVIIVGSDHGNAKLSAIRDGV